MTAITIILMISSGFVLAFLDVYSSRINNRFPQISESNRKFRLPDGRCDIRKLILFKIVLLAVLSAMAFSLYLFASAGILAFAVFPMSAIVSVPVVLGNFKLYRKYSRLKPA